MEILSLINRAGRQRMLTQKLMKLFFIQRYEVQYSGDVDQEIMECIESFNLTQIMLMNYADNCRKVSDSIVRVQDAWMKFILSFNSLDVDQVVELNGVVLIEMDKLVNNLVEQFSPNKALVVK
ncbi:MAG: hypothetical protein NE334_17220 [Lentisphaeraceae bacterium]|nr:hypothetical protein [Lentisphaeraceae bacterium]